MILSPLLVAGACAHRPEPTPAPTASPAPAPAPRGHPVDEGLPSDAGCGVTALAATSGALYARPLCTPTVYRLSDDEASWAPTAMNLPGGPDAVLVAARDRLIGAAGSFLQILPDGQATPSLVSVGCTVIDAAVAEDAVWLGTRCGVFWWAPDANRPEWRFDPGHSTGVLDIRSANDAYQSSSWVVDVGVDGDRIEAVGWNDARWTSADGVTWQSAEPRGMSVGEPARLDPVFGRTVVAAATFRGAEWLATDQGVLRIDPP